MEIHVDYREKELISELSHLEIKYCEKNLDVGDVLILNETGIHVVIERKTVKDYVSSIKDKRLPNQIIRMKQLSSENTFLMIIIEGSIQECAESKNKFFQFKNIYSSILNRIFNDNFVVINSQNINDTINWIVNIQSKLDKSESIHNLKPISYIDTISIKKKLNIDHNNCYLLQLSQIPGVSTNIAKSISHTYRNMVDLVNAYNKCLTTNDRIKMLSNIKVSDNKHIGMKLSEKIYQYLFDQSSTNLNKIVIKIKHQN